MRMNMSEKLSDYVIAAGKFASVAGLVGFVGALLTNQFIFQLWGLNFLQLATIGDVILTPISILLWMLPFLFFYGVGVGLAVLPFKPHRRSIINAIFAFVAVIFAIIHIKRMTSRGFDVGQYTTGNLPYTFSLILVVGFIATSFLLERTTIKRNILYVGHITFIFMTFLMANLVFVENGFIGHSSMRAETCDAGVIDVLWVGERAVVGRCASDGDFRVVLNPETQILNVPAGRGSPSYKDRLFGIPAPPH